MTMDRLANGLLSDKKIREKCKLTTHLEACQLTIELLRFLKVKVDQNCRVTVDRTKSGVRDRSTCG